MGVAGLILFQSLCLLPLLAKGFFGLFAHDPPDRDGLEIIIVTHVEETLPRGVNRSPVFWTTDETP